MTEEEHASQFIVSHSERTKQIASLAKIDDITVIHAQLIRLLNKEMYSRYESEALKYVKMYSEDDPRFPDRKQVLRMVYMEVLEKLIPNMFGEVLDVNCPGCNQIIDASSTDCSNCGRVVAGVNVHTETAYDDETSTSTHLDERHNEFIKRLNSFCRRDTVSINLSKKVLDSLRSHIESSDPSYNHDEVMSKPLVNGERPGTSVSMLIGAIAKAKNCKMYLHIELICQELWGWEFPVIDEKMFRFIEDLYIKIREAMSSFSHNEIILIHQNNMLYMILSLAFSMKGIKYIVKRDNFKVSRDPHKQIECDRFFTKVVERAGFEMCTLY